MEIPGLTDQCEHTGFDHDLFKRLTCTIENGYCKTRLLLKPSHPPIPENKSITIESRTSYCSAATERLAKIGKHQKNHQVMTEPIPIGIVEPVPKKPIGAIATLHSTSSGHK